MSELKARIGELIHSAMQQRPATATGVIIDFNHENGLVTVEVLSPTSPGLMKLSDLALPKQMHNVFAPGPEIGSQVNLVFPGGNPHLAQIVAVKPPDQTQTAERLGLAKPRGIVPETLDFHL